MDRSEETFTPVTDEQRASNEREQVAEVFGLTGGELMDAAWVPTYVTDFNGAFDARRPFTFTYWYQGVPDYVQSGYDALPLSYAPTYRTVCRDEMFGDVPERVTDDEGTWERVARYRTSGERECPMHGRLNITDAPCPLCEENPQSFHGYIYIGDGWAEIVYRLQEPKGIGFTPDPACDNCGGTGVFETVDNEPIPCTFCLRDAIKRGEIEGTVDD